MKNTSTTVNKVTMELVRVYADNSKLKWQFKQPGLLHMLIKKAILSGLPDGLYPDGPPSAVLDAIRRVTKDESSG